MDVIMPEFNYKLAFSLNIKEFTDKFYKVFRF